jgi:hypothetical protein
MMALGVSTSEVHTATILDLLWHVFEKYKNGITVSGILSSPIFTKIGDVFIIDIRGRIRRRTDRCLHLINRVQKKEDFFFGYIK